MFVKVKVKAGARREGFMRVGENKFEISVKEKPENNRANERVISMLSLKLKVPAKYIRFVSGMRSPSKLFEIK